MKKLLHFSSFQNCGILICDWAFGANKNHPWKYQQLSFYLISFKLSNKKYMKTEFS